MDVKTLISLIEQYPDAQVNIGYESVFTDDVYVGEEDWPEYHRTSDVYSSRESGRPLSQEPLHKGDHLVYWRTTKWSKIPSGSHQSEVIFRNPENGKLYAFNGQKGRRLVKKVK